MSMDKRASAPAGDTHHPAILAIEESATVEIIASSPCDIRSPGTGRRQRTPRHPVTPSPRPPAAPRTPAEARWIGQTQRVLATMAMPGTGSGFRGTVWPRVCIQFPYSCGAAASCRPQSSDVVRNVDGYRCATFGPCPDARSPSATAHAVRRVSSTAMERAWRQRRIATRPPRNET